MCSNDHDKCSNEHVPKQLLETFLLEISKVLEQANTKNIKQKVLKHSAWLTSQCSNEQGILAALFLFVVMFLLSPCYSTCLKRLDNVLHALNLNSPPPFRAFRTFFLFLKNWSQNHILCINANAPADLNHITHLTIWRWSTCRTNNTISFLWHIIMAVSISIHKFTIVYILILTTCSGQNFKLVKVGFPYV